MSFVAELRAEIAAAPVSVATYMARCNAHYYATRDPFGRDGDFVTAPEISQVFGELIGAWLADQWRRAGSPTPSYVVELGPGRGTMMADMLRSIAAAKWQPEIVLIEASPTLAAAQRRSHPDAITVADLADVAGDAPVFIVANEFFDALPIRQIERGNRGWHERFVVSDGDQIIHVFGSDDATPLVPHGLVAAPVGSVLELSPVSAAIAAEIGARLRSQGGAALVVDYGHVGPVTGDTLQAVRRHAHADVFVDPGDVDLTAHVDFTALAIAAEGRGVRAWGPIEQGRFLRAIGIDARAEMLKQRATSAQAATIAAGVERLTHADAMGTLFKVMALTTTAAAPPGFA